MGCGGSTSTQTDYYRESQESRSTSTKTDDDRESQEKQKGTERVNSKPQEEEEEDYIREPETDPVNYEGSTSTINDDDRESQEKPKDTARVDSKPKEEEEEVKEADSFREPETDPVNYEGSTSTINDDDRESQEKPKDTERIDSKPKEEEEEEEEEEEKEEEKEEKEEEKEEDFLREPETDPVDDDGETQEKPEGEERVDSKPQEEEEEEEYLKEPETDWVDLADTIEGYPPPRPSPNKKEHIFTEQDKNTADARADQIKVEDYQTLEDVARALTEGLKNDVQKVRAIFIWIGLQGSSGNKSTQSQDATSAQTIVQKVIQRQLPFNFLFISLCRAAKIPCVLIRGLSKGQNYEVGDRNVDNLNSSWTAVYVARGWHFVFPSWAFSAVVGHSKGTWTLVESQGKGAREKEEKSSGLTIRHKDDYYFLTDAEEFIYRCFPNDSKWQLLTRPFTKKKFIEIADCKPDYFKNHYKITTPTKCIYTSVGGVCDIGIKKLDKEECSYKYMLYFNHEESKTTLSSEIHLERYVAIFNEGHAIRFRIRFPSEGIYKMEIYGDGSWLCEFRLECDEDVNDVKPFPCNPESGFGPNSLTKEAGLQAQYHTTGFINTKKTKNVNMKFKMIKNVLVQAILIHNNMEKETLNKHVNHRIKGQELDINVDLPKKGEYALQIYTKDKDSYGPFKNVCNYLLTSDNMNKKRKLDENAIEKRTRKALQDKTSSHNISALKKALDDFDKIDLEDKGDRKKAVERLTYLSLRKELKDAVARRHGEKLEEAIGNAKSSKYESDLQELIEQAEDLLSQLRRHKSLAHEVLTMQQLTISEIHNYKHPKPMAYDVMKATYILLGEEERRVEEWEQIQALMRKTGKEGLLRRVHLFDTVNVTENMVNQASQILQPYDEERIQAFSAGLGTFYEWVTGVIEEVRKSENSPRD